MLFPNAKEMTIALDKYLPLAEGQTGEHPFVDRIFSDNVKRLAKADQVWGAIIKRDIDQTLRAHKRLARVSRYTIKINPPRAGPRCEYRWI